MHSFDPKIAQRVGVNAAVIYQNIVWWCAKNAANGRNQHDGRYWTYNSVKAWGELFPYLSQAQIRLALTKLEDAGLILSGSFNAAGYDRTKWYCDIQQVHLSEIANGVERKDKPIPDSKPDIKPDIPPNPPKGGRRRKRTQKEMMDAAMEILRRQDEEREREQQH